MYFRTNLTSCKNANLHGFLWCLMNICFFKHNFYVWSVNIPNSVNTVQTLTLLGRIQIHNSAVTSKWHENMTRVTMRLQYGLSQTTILNLNSHGQFFYSKILCFSKTCRLLSLKVFLNLARKMYLQWWKVPWDVLVNMRLQDISVG